MPAVVENYQKSETKSNIDINVFGCENKNIYPIYISKKLFELYVELSLKVVTSLCATKQDKKSFV